MTTRTATIGPVFAAAAGRFFARRVCCTALARFSRFGSRAERLMFPLPDQDMKPRSCFRLVSGSSSAVFVRRLLWRWLDDQKPSKFQPPVARVQTLDPPAADRHDFSLPPTPLLPNVIWDGSTSDQAVPTDPAYGSAFARRSNSLWHLHAVV